LHRSCRRLLLTVALVLLLTVPFPLGSLAIKEYVTGERVSRAASLPGYQTRGDVVLAAQAPDYTPLRQELLRYLDGKPATYGIYFKDLISGTEFGINDREPIHAASTIKVPVVLYLNTLAAQGKVKWEDRVTYRSDVDYQGGAGVLQFAARDGDRYSLRVLANLSVTVSDNIAYRMLVRYLGKEKIAQFMRSLGGEVVFPDGTAMTTARDMGRYIQAVLDFARQHPEPGKRLLDDMANPIYHIGLPGELPPYVTVAHKEGDVWGVTNDVGVVFGSRPYILCVLIKGVDDLDQGFAEIAHISKIVYDYQERVDNG